MKNSRQLCIMTLLMIASFMIVSCNLGSSTSSQIPEDQADLQATINSAVQSTTSAQSAIQESINTGVSATLTALPPLPSPTPVVPAELSEEQLASSIDTSVAEAENAAEECNTAVEEATADGSLTQEEIYYIDYYATYAEDEISQALELTEEYLDLYSELAEESIALMTEIENDLSTMAENTAAIEQTLEEINTNLSQGLALAESTINQLNEQAQQSADKALEMQQQTQDMMILVQAEIQNRGDSFNDLIPDQTATDLQSALSFTKDYIDTIKSSLQDNKLSGLELDSIAQKGVNAAAGLQAFGGPQLQDFSMSINGLTSQFARGELPQAKLSFASFEQNLPSIPRRP